mmetsp:Transcript_90222/g.280895  ORF Transcript_90222/g.280895 Transcript_90222/m.280895 type:complete len:255 (+) Transcript_90222:1572-2336(+)
MVFTAFSAASEAKCTADKASFIMAISFLAPSAWNLSKASLATLRAPLAFFDSIIASQRVYEATASRRAPFSTDLAKVTACSASGTAFLALSSKRRQIAMVLSTPASSAFLPASSKAFWARVPFWTAVSQLLAFPLARPTAKRARPLPRESLVSSQIFSASSASFIMSSASLVEKRTKADSIRHLASSFLSPSSLAILRASVTGSIASRRLFSRTSSVPISASASCMVASPRLLPASLNLASSSLASLEASSGSL